MMENPLLLLKTIMDKWISSSFTLCVTDTIFIFLCGLGLFLLLLTLFQSKPSSPPPKKHRNIRRRPVEPRRWSRKRSRAWEDCLQNLQEARGLISLLQSQLGGHQDKDSFHQCSCEDHRGKVCKEAPEAAQKPCREPVEDAPPTVPRLASPGPPPDHPPPVASAWSPIPVTASSVCAPAHSFLSALPTSEPLLLQDCNSPQPRAHSPSSSWPPDPQDHLPPPKTSPTPPAADSTLTLPQRDQMAPPLGTAPHRLPPHSPCLASSIAVPTISGFGHTSGHISAVSWWQEASETSCLTTSAECESWPEHLSHHRPGSLFWGKNTERQVEVSCHTLLSSDDQNLLEIQITKRIKIKLWKEIEKGESYAKQRSPDDHLNSVERVLKSLGAEQDTKAPRSSCSTEGKSEQLPGAQRLSYPNILGDHLPQKYNQLFWGLPSLHSESLVATAWISENPFAPQAASFFFNGVSNACPIQMQAKASPLRSRSQPPAHLEFQPQPLLPSTLQLQAPPVAQVQSQANLQSSLPMLSSSSPPQVGACGVSCPTAHKKPYSLVPTEIQHPEWPWLQQQRESGWALSSVGRSPQEIFSDFMSHFAKDSSGRASILPEKSPISSDLRNQMEQHVQKWLLQHHWELPNKVPEPLQLRQRQGELPGICQAQDKHGPSGPLSSTGEGSKVAQNMGFQLSQDMGEHLGSTQRRVPEGLCRDSECSLVKFPGTGSEDSECDLMLLKSDSGSLVLRRLDTNREKLLKGHLDRKFKQVSEGFIPVSVRRSWLAVNHTSTKSNTQMETRHLGSSKGCKRQVNTTHRVSLLGMDTRELLEAHITREWVRHKWGIPLKVLKAINLFKIKKAELSSTQEVTCPGTASSVSGALTTVKFTQFLGKAPEAHPEEKMKRAESGPNMESPLHGPSAVWQEMQRPEGQTPSADAHGSSKASPPREEAKPPPQSLTITWPRKTVELTERGNLQPSSSSAMAWNPPRGKSGGRASQDPCHNDKMMDMNVGSQSLSVKEARKAVEATLPAALHPESRVTFGTNELTRSQTINAQVRSLETLGTSKSLMFHELPVLQDLGEPQLNKEDVSDFQSNVRLQTEKQPQDCAKHKALAANNLPSQASQLQPEKVPPGEGVASQLLCHLTEAQRGSLEHRDPRISNLQDFWKNQKLIAPTFNRKDCRGPDPGQHARGLEKLGTSQAKSRSPPTQDKGTVDHVDRKYIQWLPEQNHSPRKSLFRNRMRTLFQWVFPKKGTTGQAILQNAKPDSFTAQCQGPVESRPMMDGETPQAQETMMAVGQVLKQKVATHHDCQAKMLNQHKQECQAPVHGTFCYHRLPSYPDQGTLRRHMACTHQAISNDHTPSIRHMQVKHRPCLNSVTCHNEQMGLSHFLSLSPKKIWSPVCPSHHGPRKSGAPGHHQHCPAHCQYQVGVWPGRP